MRGDYRIWIFLADLIAGVYLINLKLAFIKLPETFTKTNEMILFILGILLVISAIFLIIPHRRYVARY